MTPIPNSFAVNIGNVLEVWSGHASKHVASTEGRNIFQLRSTPHRVVNKSTARTRLSLPFFFEPNLEMEMPEGLVLLRDGKDPVSTYGEHVHRSYVDSFPEEEVPETETVT